MGFKISWYAIQGRTKAAALAISGLVDTGRPGDVSEARYSAAEFPGGWVIVWSEDCDFASPEHSAQFSAHETILSCQVHEGVMDSAARLHENGKEIWSVSYSSSEGCHDLAISGTPPPQLASIRKAQFAKQREHDSRAAGRMSVDHLWEVPVILAESICGHRHDHWRYDWGEPQFTIAERS